MLYSLHEANDTPTTDPCPACGETAAAQPVTVLVTAGGDQFYVADESAVIRCGACGAVLFYEPCARDEICALQAGGGEEPLDENTPLHPIGVMNPDRQAAKKRPIIPFGEGDEPPQRRKKK